MDPRKALFLLLLAGCAATPKAKAPENVAAKKSTGEDASLILATNQADGQGGADTNAARGIVTRGGLFLSEELAQACHIEAVKATPKFQFDSASIDAEDRPVLQKLATCMTEGALKGRVVSLVGHTDQMGEAEYNMALGEMRADAVRRYLHDLGVVESQLQSTSRGELDATGDGDEGRAFDRRVDISLPASR